MRKLIRRSDYVRNSLISVIGVGVAAVIPVALQPFLGRMFTPAEVNQVGLFVTITSVLAIAANFRYGYVVAITRDDEEAENVLWGSVILSFLFSVLLGLALFFLGEIILHFFKMDPEFAGWLWYIPLSVFFISASIGLNGWLTRRKKFTAMAINKSVRRGGEGIMQLCLGKMKVTGGMIYGVIIGDAINLIVHIFQFKRADGELKMVERKKMFHALKHYLDFPKYNLIPALLDTLSLYLPYLIINAVYTGDVSGQFYESRLVLALPQVLIAMAISTVLLQKLTEKRDQKQPMMPILRRHVYFLGILALIGLLVIYPFGEDLFLVFLGGQWGQAGQMASLMVFAYALKFVVTPLSQVFFATEKIRVASIWQYAYFAGMMLMMLLTDLSINAFIVCYVLIEVVFYLIYLILILKVANENDRKLL